jgi:hypothetical protein
VIRLGLTLPPRNRPTVSPAARNLRWLWIRSFCTPLPEIAHLRFRGQSRHRNRRSQCPLMDPQQGVQNPYFRVVPFIGGGRLSSVKSNSFSVNLQSILGSRMPRCANSISATILLPDHHQLSTAAHRRPLQRQQRYSRWLQGQKLDRQERG